VRDLLLLAASDAELSVRLTPQSRILAVVVALGFMGVILELIRRNRLQERYSVIWFVAGLAMLVGAAFPALLEVVADLMGVRDTNVALFSLILLWLLSLAIYFSVIVSGQADQITRLAQESAIQRAESTAADREREVPGDDEAGGHPPGEARPETSGTEGRGSPD
jgi:hypothetical protein